MCSLPPVYRWVCMLQLGRPGEHLAWCAQTLMLRNMPPLLFFFWLNHLLPKKLHLSFVSPLIFFRNRYIHTWCETKCIVEVDEMKQCARPGCFQGLDDEMKQLWVRLFFLTPFPSPPSFSVLKHIYKRCSGGLSERLRALYGMF